MWRVWHVWRVASLSLTCAHAYHLPHRHVGTALSYLALARSSVSQQLVAAGALAPLSFLLQSTVPRVHLPALRCIATLSETPALCERLLRAGVMPPLLELAQEPATETRLRAAYTMANVAAASAHCCRRMCGLPEVVQLVTLARDRHTEVVHRAVRALAALCAMPCRRCASLGAGHPDATTPSFHDDDAGVEGDSDATASVAGGNARRAVMSAHGEMGGACVCVCVCVVRVVLRALGWRVWH